MSAPRADVTAALPRWARVAAAPFVLLTATLLPALTAAGLARGADLQSNTAVYVLVCASVSIMTVAFLALVMRRVDRRPLSESGLVSTRASIPLLLLGTLISIVIMVLVTVALTRAGLGRDAVTATPAQFWGGLPALLASAFLLQGFPEELIFRGYVMSMFAESPARAILVSTLVFGVIHIASNGGQRDVLERLLYLGPATAMGLLAAALVLTTQSLWAAVGVHGGLHVGGGVAELFGAAQGPAIWAGTAVIYAVAAGVVLTLGRHRLRERVRVDR